MDATLRAKKLDPNGPRPLPDDDKATPGRNSLGQRLRRALTQSWFRTDREYQSIASYNGLVVFDNDDLDTDDAPFAQGFLRALVELRLIGAGRLLEACAGPGHIGYSLLAHGVCDALTLADADPRAIAAARKTAEYNQLGAAVTIFASDGLDRVPQSEKWNLVVGNLSRTSASRDGAGAVEPIDRWRAHRRFYTKVGRHVARGGRVVLQESRLTSTPDLFESMIREGGGRIARVHEGKTFRGANELYYVVTEWPA